MDVHIQIYDCPLLTSQTSFCWLGRYFYLIIAGVMIIWQGTLKGPIKFGLDMVQVIMCLRPVGTYGMDVHLQIYGCPLLTSQTSFCWLVGFLPHHYWCHDPLARDFKRPLKGLAYT